MYYGEESATFVLAGTQRVWPNLLGALIEDSSVIASRADRQDVMLRAAELYFMDGLTQAAVAERLGCTRWTVGRLLVDAEEAGVFSVQFHHPRARIRQLEQELQDTFGLLGARVVPTQQTPVESLSLVARHAASYLADQRPQLESLAVGWGKTVAAVARAIPEGWADHPIVAQACGVPDKVNAVLRKDVINVFARKSKGVGLTIPAPPMVKNAAEAARYLTDPKVSSVLNSAAQADASVFSLVSPQESSLIVRSRCFSVEQLRSLWRMGAVANIMGHFIDAEGNAVSDEIESCLVAVPLERLRAAKHSVAVVAEVSKAQAMSAAIQGGLAKAVVLDSDTALAMLKH